MPKPTTCPFSGSPLWLASVALMVQSVISTSSTYRRPALGGGGKRTGLMERTLILLDVNTRSPVQVLNDNFLSLQLDPSIIQDGWLDFLSSKRLVTLARGLSPAYLRFGGKRTDFLQFHNLKNLAKFRGPGPDYYLKNYEDAGQPPRHDAGAAEREGSSDASRPPQGAALQHLQQHHNNRSLDKLYNFAECAGLHLVLGLNALQRNPDSSWNSSSALSLLKYSAGKKYNISWELGNEPNGYRSMVGQTVNSTQLANDYTLLRTLLQSVRYYSRAHLYGPNAGRPRKNAILLLDGFMKNAGSVVDAVTWQHYYMDSRVTKVEDFLKTRLLDTLTEQITKVLTVVNSHAPGKKVWLSGVGPAWSGGTNNLSDTYAAGFLWLNTLGMAAMQGIDVVLRHSFFDYGYTHLVDQHFNPLPDYWFSLVFKRLVGPRVLAVRVAGLQRKPRPGRVIRDKLRIYAHCTSFHNHNYVRGSITIYIINLHRSRKKIKLAGTLRNMTVHQYLLQPYGTDGLHARSVQLNGERLLMLDNETFPELKPQTLRAGRTIAIPPMTIGFYVIKNINAYACRR
ncbi:inactive heparanase-2-like [Coregonus clupeaformis]|uniref:inactive heparanase-2-like n=1 Tax=Coregonus clupeaformis TaxID=59861 RepID=UPI001BDF8789|nr:inactive heparanase-2-like [Coregonus clupeaformis]